MRLLSSRGTAVIATAVTAAVAVTLQFHQTVGYGFYYDDYHFVRPYPWRELLQVLHGSWDPLRIEVPFFRPLTIWFYAARFAVFGLNAPAYHALGLAMFGAVAALAGFLVYAWSRSIVGACAAVVAVVIHPSMPYASVAWVTNQMHLLEDLVVLAALLWWSFVRRRSAAWWVPLVVLQIAAALVKEDGFVLPVAILALHVLDRLIVDRDLRWPPASWGVASVACMAALLAFRADALHGLGGYGRPTPAHAWDNVIRGLTGVLRLLPARRPWQGTASWFVTLLPIGALLSWRVLKPTWRFGIVAGLALAVLFDLPFVFVVKAEQMHLVALGAALMLACAGMGIVEAARGRVARAMIVVVLVAGAAAEVAVSRNITRDFEPFGPIVLHADGLVSGWAAVPIELRQYLQDKRSRLPGVTANPATSLSSVAFGVGLPERDPAGRTIRWMNSTTAQVEVRGDATVVSIPVRHEIGAFREPASLRIVADGRVLDAMSLASGEWRLSTIALRPDGVSPLRRTHVIRLDINRTWVPAEVIPGSTDTRTLGLQIGEIAVR